MDYDNFEIHVTEVRKLPNEEWIKAKFSKITSKDGKYGKMYVFHFQTGEAYGNQVVWSAIGTEVSNNPNSKVYKWYTGMLGRELVSGENIVLKDLIGKTFEVFLESKISGTKVFQNITKVRRAYEDPQAKVSAVKPAVSVVKTVVPEVKKEVVKPVEQPKVTEQDLDFDDLPMDEDIPL